MAGSRELELIEIALDSAGMAQDLLQVGGGPRPSRARLLLGVLGVGARAPQESLPPTRETVRRMANALDEFATDFAALVDAPETDLTFATELRSHADGVATLGARLWDVELQPPEANIELGRVVGLLRERRTRIVLGR